MIGEVVMFQDNSQFGNPSGTGSNVTSNQWEVYKNTAIIDINDFSLREIQRGTLTLRDLGVENLTGVALRYVGENGDKIDVRRIGNIPGNAAAVQVAPRNNDFGRNQTVADRVNRGTRSNERQFDSFDQREVTFSDRNQRQDDRRDFGSAARDTVNNSGWDLNDNQRVRQPSRSRQTFQRDDRSVSRRDSRDSFQDDNRDRFGYESRDFSRSSDRRLSNDYLDGLQRRDFDDRDQRNADYVRNRINQNRSDDYSTRDDFRRNRYEDDVRFDDEPYSRSIRTSTDRRDNRYSEYDGRSSDYDANFASQQRELQQRLLDAKRLEARNADDAAWLERQRKSMEEARLARLYQDDLTPLRRPSTISSSYSSGPYGFGAERLADRSTDLNYRGRRTDALTPAAAASNASADRVAQILAEKEADLDAKPSIT